MRRMLMPVPPCRFFIIDIENKYVPGTSCKVVPEPRSIWLLICILKNQKATLFWAPTQHSSIRCRCLAGGSPINSGLISLWYFTAGYFFVVTWELCISPIGLSMITKLSPGNMVSLMMGVWFFATACGEFLASKIGALMSVPVAVRNSPVASMPY